MTTPTLNLIGPGRLGQTLARLWHDAGLVTVCAIVGRSKQNTAMARDFIGAGTSTEWPDLPPANLTLLATPDDAIAGVVEHLASCQVLRKGDIVFHCSGALSSALLAQLSPSGVHTGSIHPLKSFARPELAIVDFTGTYCAYEGDAPALARLLPLFTAIGAHCFPIDATKKTLYHAGAVLGCNALVALMQAALQSMAAAGVPPEVSWPALRPLIDGTLANLDRLGPAAALTGPVMRGDAVTVARQYTALNTLDPQLADVYAALGKLTLTLANLSAEQQQRIQLALNQNV
ncbi:MAG: DUF2520 domain-containing protein [Formivibrio sp.]|nr:DUF2520 domain-containing protein [Formivibrio sp.]